MSGKKLSVCIATYNRSKFLAQTLDTILPQLTGDCEVVISDNASTDDTSALVADYQKRFAGLRYLRHEVNQGLDINFDAAIEFAQGEYCWLFSDDDYMMPGGIERVLGIVRGDSYSLVIVNAEVRDFEMSRVLMPRSRDFKEDKVYRPADMDQLFSDLGSLVQFIGSFVVDRSLWLERDRQRYYGSLFIHIGVMFQQPLPEKALVVAESFVSYRFGNRHAFGSKMFETYMINLPGVVWSLNLSVGAKERVCPVHPWKNSRALLFRRALGQYSLLEYQQVLRPRLRSVIEKLRASVLATLPGLLINALFVFYYRMLGDRFAGSGVQLYYLSGSRFHYKNWRAPGG